MAYDSLKAFVQQYIKQNENQEITGPVLQNVLLQLITSLGNGFEYAGIANASTNPGSPEGQVFYITKTPGTYTNFLDSNNTPIVVPQGISILKYNGTYWALDSVLKSGDLINVNDANNQSTAYGSAQLARTMVPVELRKPGLQITYLLSTGWVVDQYIGPDESASTPTPWPNWSTASNWQVLGPVRVSQNTGTGHSEIHIGSNTYPVASVDDFEKCLREIRRDNISINYAWVNGSGEFISLSNADSITIGIKAGDKVKILANNSDNTMYGVFSSREIGAVSSVGRIIISSGLSAELTIENDGYLVFCGEYNSHNYTPKSVFINGIDCLKDYSQALSDALGDLLNKIYKDSTNELLEGFGYIGNYGEYHTTQSAYKCTDYIYIKNCNVKLYQVYASQYGVAAYCVYDKDKHKISSSTPASQETIYSTITLDNLPANACYIRATTFTTVFDSFKIEREISWEKIANIVLYDDLAIEENTEDIEELQSFIHTSDEYDADADLSGITNSGFIKANHTIGNNPIYKNGRVVIPLGAKTITFNNLPSAQYSDSVYAYFVDSDGNFIGTNIRGDYYLGAGVVTFDVPKSAKGLMLTAYADDLANYNIYFHVVFVCIKEQVNANTEDIEELQSELSNEINILIPDVIFAIVGTELNIWNDAVSLSIDKGLSSPVNYTVAWQCNKGLVTDRCYRFLPTVSDIGEYACSCKIFRTDNHKLIASKIFSIKVLAKDALDTSVNIVHFGDSLGAETAIELYNNFHNSDRFTGSIPSMLGTRGTTPHYEAVGGYTWRDYATKGETAYRISVAGVTSVNVGAVYAYDGTNYTIREVNIVNGTGNLLLEKQYGASGNIEGVTNGVITLVTGSGDNSINFTNSTKEGNNPLWDATLNKLSVAKYKERLGLQSTDKIDAVSFQFGVNESIMGDVNYYNILNYYIVPLYNAFITDNPNCKFIVGLTTSCGNDANGAGANYGASRNIRAFLENSYNFRKMYLDSLQGEYSNLYIAPVQLQLDRYYGYGFSTRAISQRTSTTEQYHNNFVHPIIDGYGQIADALFATYIGCLTED